MQAAHGKHQDRYHVMNTLKLLVPYMYITTTKSSFSRCNGRSHENCESESRISNNFVSLHQVLLLSFYHSYKHIRLSVWQKSCFFKHVHYLQCSEFPFMHSENILQQKFCKKVFWYRRHCAMFYNLHFAMLFMIVFMFSHHV